MESLIQTFHINYSLLLAQVVNFAIVFLVLYKFALKPLTKVMHERTATIEKGIEDAKVAVTSLEDAQKDAKQLLTQTKIEAQEIVKKAQLDADTKKQQMIEQAKAQVGVIVDSAKQQINQEKLKMIAEAKAEIGSLVIESTRAILSGAINKDVDASIVKSISEQK